MAQSCIMYEHVSVASARYPPRTDWIVERCDIVVTDPWPLLFESFHLSVAGRLPGWIWRNSQCLVEDGLTRQHPFLQLTENKSKLHVSYLLSQISSASMIFVPIIHEDDTSWSLIAQITTSLHLIMLNIQVIYLVTGVTVNQFYNVTCRSSLDRVIILVMFFCRPAIRCFSLSDISILQSRLSTSSPPNGSSVVWDRGR